MSTSTEQHRRAAPPAVCCAVITVSDSRTLETDRGGQMIVEKLTAGGHEVARRDIVSDEPGQIAALLRQISAQEGIDAILLTGGTGIAARDQTFEAVAAMLTKVLPGYGELFRMLSYEEIGAAAMLSRAIGGVLGRVIVLTMPGSTAAVRLAMEKLILPELAHLVWEARK